MRVRGCERFGRLLDRYVADWQMARRPFIQEITRLAMARDAVTPRTMTFAWASANLGDIPDVAPAQLPIS